MRKMCKTFKVLMCAICIILFNIVNCDIDFADSYIEVRGYDDGERECIESQYSKEFKYNVLYYYNYEHNRERVISNYGNTLFIGHSLVYLASKNLYDEEIKGLGLDFVCIGGSYITNAIAWFKYIQRKYDHIVLWTGYNDYIDVFDVEHCNKHVEDYTNLLVCAREHLNEGGKITIIQDACTDEQTIHNQNSNFMDMYFNSLDGVTLYRPRYIPDFTNSLDGIHYNRREIYMEIVGDVLSDRLSNLPPIVQDNKPQQRSNIKRSY